MTTSLEKSPLISTSLVRYCPECGFLGEVPADKKDCCPTGNLAVRIPLGIAMQARVAFLNELKGLNDEIIMEICEGYESGYGHGLKKDGLDLKRTPHSNPMIGKAYQYGYERGLEKAEETPVKKRYVRKKITRMPRKAVQNWTSLKSLQPVM